VIEQPNISHSRSLPAEEQNKLQIAEASRVMFWLCTVPKEVNSPSISSISAKSTKMVRDSHKLP
jgi:hypothetical protein